MGSQESKVLLTSNGNHQLSKEEARNWEKTFAVYTPKRYTSRTKHSRNRITYSKLVHPPY